MNLILFLSVLIIAINALVILAGIIVGYKRGAGKSLVRLIYVFIITAVSYIFAIIISKAVSGQIVATVQLQYYDTLQSITENSKMFEPLMRGLVASVLGPVILPLIFIILQPLTMIGFKPASGKIISLFKKDGDPMNKSSRFMGAGVGALQGYIIATVLAVPLSFAVFLLGSVNKNNVVSNDNYIAKTTSCSGIYSLSLNSYPHVNSLAALSLSGRSYNGNFLLGAGGLTNMGTIIPGGSQSNLLDEGEFIMGLLNAASDGFLDDLAYGNLTVGEIVDILSNWGGGTDFGLFGNGSENDTYKIISIIQNMIPYIEQSPLLSSFAADILNTAAEVWKNGGSFLGISIDTSDYATELMFNSFTDMLAGATAGNVAEILKTFFTPSPDGTVPIASFISINLNEGIDFSSNGVLNIISDIMIAVNYNDNTSMITSSMGKLGKQLLAEAGITVFPAEDTAVYEEIKAVLEDALSNISGVNDYMASVDALAAEIMRISASYNQTLTEGQARFIAICLLEYFGSAENITIDGIKEFFGVGDAIPASAG